MKHNIMICLILLSNILIAGDVKITEELESLIIQDGNKEIKIERIQDQKHRLTSSFTKTSRKCPPFCVQPIKIGNVKTIGEIELLKYIKEIEKDNADMLLIDARTKNWLHNGTIPTATNLPFTMIQKDSKYLNKILNLLGAKEEKNGKWNFDKVPSMIIFSNGLWDPQAPKAIQSLIELGCPEDKILYYRGGMQDWNILGLTLQLKED